MGAAFVRGSTLLPPIALALSFPFLFVGAPALHLFSFAPSLVSTDATFLALVGGWASTYVFGALLPVFTKRAAATATPVLTSVVASLPPRTELWLGGGGARAVALAAPAARVVATWPELDAALDAWRSGTRKR